MSTVSSQSNQLGELLKDKKLCELLTRAYGLNRFLKNKFVIERKSIIIKWLIIAKVNFFSEPLFKKKLLIRVDIKKMYNAFLYKIKKG